MVFCLHLQVSRDDEGDGTRKVDLSGSQGAVDEAKRIIEDIVGSDGKLLTVSFIFLCIATSCIVYFAELY